MIKTIWKLNISTEFELVKQNWLEKVFDCSEEKNFFWICKSFYEKCELILSSLLN